MIGQSLAAQPLHASVSHDVNKEDGCWSHGRCSTQLSENMWRSFNPRCTKQQWKVLLHAPSFCSSPAILPALTLPLLLVRLWTPSSERQCINRSYCCFHQLIYCVPLWSQQLPLNSWSWSQEILAGAAAAVAATDVRVMAYSSDVLGSAYMGNAMSFQPSIPSECFCNGNPYVCIFVWIYLQKEKHLVQNLRSAVFPKPCEICGQIEDRTNVSAPTEE